MFKRSLLITFIIMGYAQLHFAQTGAPAKNLVPVISKSGKTEFSPTISADGRTLIYETQTKDKWELYESKLLDNGAWSEPVPLKVINDKCNFIAGPSLSYDGNTLFYTAFIEEVTKSEDIFYSERLADGNWSEPKSIGAPINNDDSYEGFPSISSDGSTLYFIRINEENDYDKKSKETCFKIYSSNREAGGWSVPVPLPKEINSGCERDPRIMADNHTLIFSSIREGGLGKYDLYQTRKKPDGTWIEPVALAFVNSDQNDQSPCISASGSTIYYYSNNDIYQTEIPQEYRQMINVTLKGSVTSTIDNSPLSATVQVRNMASGEGFQASAGDDGKFSLVLAAGAKHELIVSQAGYVSKQVVLDYAEQKTYLEANVDIALSNVWNLVYSVKDKDLGTPITAYVTMNDGSADIFKDSIRKEAFPKTWAMTAGKTYNVTVLADGYPPSSYKIEHPGDTTVQLVINHDIEHEKVQIVAEVTDISSGGRKRTKVTYKNEDTGEVIIAEAGEVVNLRKGDRYQIVTNSEKGYAYAMKSVVAGETAAIDLAVTKVEEGAKLSLNHIYFKSGSWELDQQSELELSNIVSLLQLNPNVTIEIAAHTDDVGEDAFNQELSQKRAQSVTTYLSKAGVSLKQLVAKGYGKTKPLIENTTDENRAKNRRVELLVVGVN